MNKTFAVSMWKIKTSISAGKELLSQGYICYLGTEAGSWKEFTIESATVDPPTPAPIIYFRSRVL